MTGRALGSPRGGLEPWLARKLQHGHLKDLPLFYPLKGEAGQPPERYARQLLAELKKPGADTWAVERVKDDGRAFRGWVESMLVDAAPVFTPRRQARLSWSVL